MSFLPARNHRPKEKIIFLISMALMSRYLYLCHKTWRCTFWKLILVRLSNLTQRNEEIKKVLQQLNYLHNKDKIIVRIVDRYVNSCKIRQKPLDRIRVGSYPVYVVTNSSLIFTHVCMELSSMGKKKRKGNELCKIMLLSSEMRKTYPVSCCLFWVVQM